MYFRVQGISEVLCGRPPIRPTPICRLTKSRWIGPPDQRPRSRRSRLIYGPNQRSQNIIKLSIYVFQVHKPVPLYFHHFGFADGPDPISNKEGLNAFSSPQAISLRRRFYFFGPLICRSSIQRQPLDLPLRDPITVIQYFEQCPPGARFSLFCTILKAFCVLSKMGRFQIVLFGARTLKSPVFLQTTSIAQRRQI